MNTTNRKRITVRTQTEDGEWTSRRISVPADALTDGQRTHANQVSAGLYETDTYVSPRGIVIARMYSCWDDGRGRCEGTYYAQVTDPVRLAEEFGAEPKQIPAL